MNLGSDCTSCTTREAVRTLVVGLTVLLALVVAAPRAEAGPGDGIRQGYFLIHPAVAVEGRYDTNVFRVGPDDQQTDLTAAPLLRLLPQVTIETLPSRKAELQGTAGLELRTFLHDSPQVDNQSNFGAHLDLRGAVGMDSWIGAEAIERFYFQPEPGSDQNFLTDVTTFDRLYNHTELRGVLRPGHGMLEFTPRYQLLLERFLDFSVADRTIHTVGLDGRWKFFPKTAVVVRSSYGWREFDNDYIPSSNPLRVTGGLLGLITPKLSLDLEVGYGNSFTDEAESFSSVIGTLRATERFTERMILSGGYRRDFRDTPWSSHYDSHLFDLRWNQQIAGQVGIQAGVSYEFRFFTPLLASQRGVTLRDEIRDERQDGVTRGELLVEWHPNDWFTVGAGYQLERRATDAIAAIETSDGMATIVNDAAYIKHQVYTRLGVLY
ncbi:MAG: outer membrane beta-barrel protein [Myxococcota bacterium]|jgi:hypothetical protein|nr:outer membrane beta-barrel protein [Myxococcota bacterium]